MRKNEVKASKDGRHLLKLSTSCEEILSNNTKEHIKSVIFGATSLQHLKKEVNDFDGDGQASPKFPK